MHEPILRAIAGDSGVLATLGRLLVLGKPQPRAAVAAALPHLGVDGLVALGLGTSDAETVTPTALLRPQSFVDADGVGEWWIASDLDEVALDGPLPADHVLGVGERRARSPRRSFPSRSIGLSIWAPAAVSRRSSSPVAPAR